LVFCFDILHAIAELNRASHCIIPKNVYFEVSAVSIVMMLWAVVGLELGGPRKDYKGPSDDVSYSANRGKNF